MIYLIVTPPRPGAFHLSFICRNAYQARSTIRGALAFPGMMLKKEDGTEEELKSAEHEDERMSYSDEQQKLLELTEEDVSVLRPFYVARNRWHMALLLLKNPRRNDIHVYSIVCLVFFESRTRAQLLHSDLDDCSQLNRALGRDYAQQ